MANAQSYMEGSTVRVQATFAVAGVNTDPTTVTLKVKDTDGATTTYTYALAEVTRFAAGVYYKDITPKAVTTDTGWTYRWIGTGTAAGVGEATCTLLPSQID